MAPSAKASIKRGKPSYFMLVLGVTLVLFILGIIGWLIINANKLGDHFKENVEVNVYLREQPHPKDSAALMEYIAAKPYVRSQTYVTKEMAKKKFNQENTDDWDRILEENPLPPSIDFTLKKDYVNVDSLQLIKADLEKQTFVDEVRYQQELVSNLTKNIQRVSAILLAIAIILAVVVIILIDNTIKLAMFSNRFLIKTMQMVGATRGFIAKPMNLRAIFHGALAGVIAAVAVYFLIFFAERRFEDLKIIRDDKMLILLFISLIILGICITLFSTHRSVIKYLKMKLDDLY